MSENNKPVVESFQLDHTKVKAPYVRYIDTQTGPNGDVISNYDLRLVQPNENAIPTGGLHTIEHTIAVLLRERIPGYIDCSPFGCRTGFHLLTWGEHSTEDVARALKESLEFIANEATWEDVPATTAEGSGAATSWPRASAPTHSNARWSERPPHKGSANPARVERPASQAGNRHEDGSTTSSGHGHDDAGRHHVDGRARKTIRRASFIGQLTMRKMRTN